jgi:hypothetical protein
MHFLAARVAKEKAAIFLKRPGTAGW